LIRLAWFSVSDHGFTLVLLRFIGVSSATLGRSNFCAAKGGSFRPHYKEVNLTKHKNEVWKKWIQIYNEKMRSRGTFLDLYTYGYDWPERYAISKDGEMYYGFFASKPNEEWKGDVELRGLKPGAYEVFDYVEGKSLGKVQAENGKIPKLPVGFRDHLLLEVRR
jgi:alpha-galactosidase